MARHRRDRQAVGFLTAFFHQSTGLAINRLGSAAAAVIYARALGPTDRGIYAIVNLAAQLLAYLILRGSDVWANRGLTGASSWFRRRILLLAAISVPVFLTGIVFSPASTTLAFSGLIYAWCCAVFFMAAGIRAGNGQVGGWKWMFIARGALAVGAAGLAWHFLGHIRPAAANLVDGVTFLICALPLPAPLLRERAIQDDADRRAFAREGRFVALGFLVLYALYRADAYLVGAFLGLRALGIFAAVSALAEVLLIIPDAFQPTILRLASKNAHRRQVALVSGAVAVGGTALAGVVALASPALIRLIYGSAYLPGSALLRWLVTATVILGVWKVLASYVMGIGESSIRLVSAALGCAVMLVVDCLTLPHLGLVGAAVGPMCGYSVALGIAAVSVTRIQQRSPSRGATDYPATPEEAAAQ